MAQFLPHIPLSAQLIRKPTCCVISWTTHHGQSIGSVRSLSLSGGINNIISFICQLSFKNEDPALKAIQNVNGWHPLEVLSKEVLLDIFPALKVRMGPGPTGRPPQHTLTDLSSFLYSSLQTHIFS